MKTPRTFRLIQLKARLNDVIEFRTLPDGTEVDEYGHPILKTGAVAGAGAGALYAAGRSMSQPGAGGLLTAAQAANPPGMAGRAAQTVGAGARRVGNYAKGLGGVAKEGKVGIAALLAKLKGLKFSNTERLVQLSEKLGEVIQFREGWVAANSLFAPKYARPISEKELFDDPKNEDQFGYHPELLRQRGKQAAGIAAVGGVVGYSGHRAAPHIKAAAKAAAAAVPRKASAARGAFNTAMHRDAMIAGKELPAALRRAIRGASKAAIHA